MIKIPGPSVGYVDLLDEHTLKKSATASEGKQYNPLRPSSAGKCTRELAYAFAEYRGLRSYPKKVNGADLERLFSLGHSIEWNILKQFEGVELFKVKYRQQVVTFFPITEKELIEGSIDFVFWSDEHRCIGDIKSKKDKYSSYFSNKWDEDTATFSEMASVQSIGTSGKAFWIPDLKAFLDELRDPWLPDNFYQLNGYACTDFIQERGIDHAVIIQYNKNDSRTRELRFAPSKEVFEMMKVKFETVQRVVDVEGDPELAPKDHVLGSQRCGFCQYNKVCYPNNDALKEHFATWPKKQWPTDASRVDSNLESLYEAYKSCQSISKDEASMEEQILKIMEREKVQKVKFSDGHVYEMKFLKSPRPHYELRRSKA